MEAKVITPILNVSDMQASFAWFEKLGWGKAKISQAIGESE